MENVFRCSLWWPVQLQLGKREYAYISAVVTSIQKSDEITIRMYKRRIKQAYLRLRLIGDKMIKGCQYRADMLVKRGRT